MSDRHDPYRNNRFVIEIDGIVAGGVSRVKLPETVSATVECCEDNETPTPRKLARLSFYDPLVIEKGVSDRSLELYEWFRLVQQGTLDEARRRAVVILLDEEGSPGPRWVFRDAWPARYIPPELRANTNRIAVETFEIAHEDMERLA